MLILWDIDQTLIDLAVADRRMWSEICASLLDVAPQPIDPEPGCTIRSILHQGLLRHGASDAQAACLLPEALAAEVSWLSDRDRLRRKGRLIDGAEQALREMAHTPGVIQTVLTGNQRDSARLKLDAFGLSDYLSLEFGAYGSDSDHRAALVGIARERVSERYGSGEAEVAVLVGDSVRDVMAARESATPIIAVSSGKTSPSELRTAGADAVLRTLNDHDGFRAALSLVGRRPARSTRSGDLARPDRPGRDEESPASFNA